MKKFVKILTASFALLFCLQVFSLQACATEVEIFSDPYIIVESYEVTKERIIPGESFTLTLNLSNYSQTETVREVVVDIINPAGVAPMYGTVSQVFVGDMEPGCKKQISIEYDTSMNIKSEMLDFEITLLSLSKTNYVTLRIPAGEEQVISVVAVNTPTIVYAGTVNSASVSYRIQREGIKEASINVECNGEVLSTWPVQSIALGTTQTEMIDISFEKSDTYDIEFFFEYSDSEGTVRREYVDVRTIEVREIEQYVEPDTSVEIPQSEAVDDSTMIVLLSVGGILILTIFLIVVVLVRKKR